LNRQWVIKIFFALTEKFLPLIRGKGVFQCYKQTLTPTLSHGEREQNAFVLSPSGRELE